jgi:hypothetical protein
MRIFLGLGAVSLVAVGCLLVNPLGRLEGPLEEAGGADGAGGAGGTTSGSGGQVQDGSIAEASSEADAPPSGPVVFVDRRPKNDAAPKPCPKGIALTATEVFWVEAQPGPVGILHAPKDGSMAPLHADRPSDDLLDPFDLGLDDTYLYWSDFTGNVVRRRPLADTNLASDYFPGSRHTAYLAVGPNGSIFVTDYHAAFGSVVLGPGNPSSIAVSVDAAPVAGIALCMNMLFWAWGQPSNIASKSPADNTTTEPQRMFLPAPGGAITGIACRGDELYWIQDNRMIQWINIQTKATNDPLYTSDTDMGVGDIAVDDDSLYFTQPDNHLISKLRLPPLRDR